MSEELTCRSRSGPRCCEGTGSQTWCWPSSAAPASTLQTATSSHPATSHLLWRGSLCPYLCACLYTVRYCMYRTFVYSSVYMRLYASVCISLYVKDCTLCSFVWHPRKHVHVQYSDVYTYPYFHRKPNIITGSPIVSQDVILHKHPTLPLPSPSLPPLPSPAPANNPLPLPSFSLPMGPLYWQAA